MALEHHLQIIAPNSNTGTLTNMNNSDWVTSYAVIGDLGSSYKTDVEAIWSVSGTSESDASNGLTMTVGSALSTGNFAVFGNNNTNATYLRSWLSCKYYS